MNEMEGEPMLGDIYEEIADRLAEARTRALMGERQEALGLMQAARLEYTRFREVLKDYPGHHALEYAFDITLGQLCAEQSHDDELRHDELRHGDQLPVEQPKPGARSRRKAKRAA